MSNEDFQKELEEIAEPLGIIIYEIWDYGAAIFTKGGNSYHIEAEDLVHIYEVIGEEKTLLMQIGDYDNNRLRIAFAGLK